MGYIHSYETAGLVDGPGVRFVVFMQGCKLRCSFCHNPEMWKQSIGMNVRSEEVIKKILKYKNYFKNGGVTFSGGEPLMQPEFLIECLKLCKENEIHTCIDTSGVGLGNYEEILKYVDLVMLDIKSIYEEQYEMITKHNINDFNQFLNICKKLNKKMWIRQVIIPTINDTKEYIEALKNYVAKINNVEKIELLPYHLYGVSKYEKLKIDYPLEDIAPLSDEKYNYLKKILDDK